MIKDKPTRPTALVSVLAAVVLAGCAETSRQEATGRGSVRGINAIVEATELQFRNEERVVGNITYRQVAGFRQWDDLDYTFNFDFFPVTDPEATRLASQYIDVIADTEYTLVLTGTMDNASIVLWEAEERDFVGDETIFEADFAHMSPQLGEVDVYYALEGTTPILGEEVGTLNFGDRLPYRELQPGDYELIITAPDDPATILFQSFAITQLAAERITIMLFDTEPAITAPIGVNIINANGTAAPVADVNSPPLVRAYHAAFGTANFDVYLNDDQVTPAIPNVGFGDLSASIDIIDAANTLVFAPVGDPQNPFVQGDVVRVSNTRATIAMYGPPGESALFFINQDARPLAPFPSFRVTHLASDLDLVNIYQVEQGTVVDEDTAPAFIGVFAGSSSGFLLAEAGMREIVLTAVDDTVPIATLSLDLVNGDVVDIVVVDTADPAVPEMRIFETLGL